MKPELLFRFLLSIGMGRFLLWQNADKLTVLSLHRISPETDFFWQPIHPHNFEQLLQFLSKHYTVTSFSGLAEFEHKKRHTKPLLILSFDDGYRDFYTYALPLLKQYGLPANHNIVNACANNQHQIWTQRMNSIFQHSKQIQAPPDFSTLHKNISFERAGKQWMPFYLQAYRMMMRVPLNERLAWIESQEKRYTITAQAIMMNWQEIGECAANGIEIGSHTYQHDVLSSIHDIEVLKKEIIDAVTELRSKLNREVKVLALPNGEGHLHIKEIAAAAGIEFILYVGEKLNALPLVHSKEIQDIYRINLVQESLPQMKLRTASFHSKIRKYA